MLIDLVHGRIITILKSLQSYNDFLRTANLRGIFFSFYAFLSFVREDTGSIFVLLKDYDGYGKFGLVATIVAMVCECDGGGVERDFARNALFAGVYRFCAA